MLGIGIGRQDGETARDAVELDQGERRGQLAAGGDEDGFAGQFFEPAAEAGAAGKIGDADARVAIEEEAAPPNRCTAAAIAPQCAPFS